ncbi:RusA family crossover junction endodeoxyribonuclease [Bacillaceae bacterium]
MIQFTVYGEPVAQGRPRATSVNGYVRMYDPRKSRDYKDYVRLVASEHAPDKLIEGPIALWVRVYRPIPKDMSKKRRALAEQGKLRPTKKPDVDNYLKSIKDALKNVIWKDDSQVVRVIIDKFYSEKPRVEISIEEIEEPKVS